MEKNFSLSVIIPTIVRGSVLYETLEQAINILSQFQFPWEIIVVNDSTNKIDTQQIHEIHLFNLHKDKIKILDHPQKRKPALARNYGAKHAQYGYYLFLDDDILITKKSIEFLVNFFSKHSSAVANVPWSYPEKVLNHMGKKPLGRFKIHIGWIKYEACVPHLQLDTKKGLTKVYEFATSFICMPKEIFWRLGGFRDLMLSYDQELSRRLRENNIDIYINLDIRVYHNEIDRFEIKKWYYRELENARERLRMLKIMGEERYLPPKYSKMKKLILKGLSLLRNPLLAIAEKWPNTTFLDPMFFRLIRVINAVAVYEGFFTNKESLYGKN